MPLPDGARLGSYEILSALGAGGMGEVYRAHDTRLDRDVAIKLLPEAFAAEVERLARFQREAKVLASLNHPHIAAIYGLEDAEGVKALVMELVEGEDLAQRLARGAIPLDEALPIARQIAEALEAAHEQGIIHRDLKPANIRVRPDGTVKVLDFGLAKPLEPAAGTGPDVAQSPTITSPAITRLGIILGTAAYMSPEQVKGRQADKRSDVWAFGAVLYEMLSGRRAFKGDDISDTLAAVLRQDVDWTALLPSTPAPVRNLIARCLDRDAKRRLRDIGEARIVLEDPVARTLGHARDATLTPPRPLWRRGLPFAMSLLAAGALGGAAVWTLRPSTTPAVVRFAFALPQGQNFTTPGRSHIAISPDGTKMVYVANFRLYLRSMGDFDARPIHGTDIAPSGRLGSFVSSPAFSPDGQFVAFFSGTDNTLKTISVNGGAAAPLCPATNVFGLSWGDTGIVFGQGAGGIMRVSPNGGTPEQLISVQGDEIAHGPEILPDGRSLLRTLTTGNNPDRWDKARIVVQSLTSGERKILVERGSDARYSPTGHLLYALGGVEYAAPFDLGRLETTGSAVPVVEGVRRAGIHTGTAQLSFSRRGSLIYIPGPVSSTGDQRDLAWVDRTGAAAPLKLPAGSYEHVRVSPDGQRLTFGTDDGQEANVHVFAPESGTSVRRLTFGGNNRFPIWAARGTRIAFQSDRDGDRGIFWQPVDGGKAERLTKADKGTAHVPEAWAPDGDRLLYTVTRGSSVTLWTLSLKEKTNTRVDAVESSVPIGAVFSPDGRWIAYAINNTVYVQPFPPTGSQHQISKRGHHPIWSSGSKELFYELAQFQFHVVAVQTEPSFTFGNPVSWPGVYGSTPHISLRNRDIAPDGKRFISPIPAESVSVQEIRVVLNWFEELKRLVPPK
jgi:eukaryotic-like serine/threonine-protein kinase